MLKDVLSAFIKVKSIMEFVCFAIIVISNFLIHANGLGNVRQEAELTKNFTQGGKMSFTLTLSDAPENTKLRVETSNNFRRDDMSAFIVTLLNNAQSIIEDAKIFAASHTSYLDSTTCAKPMDCSEIKKRNPKSKSGVFKIWPRSRISSGSISVYCDMEDEGGAWTVIQRRGNFDSGELYFYQNWAAYKTGFGNLHKDFWLGNENIFALTNQVSNMVKITLSDWEGNTTYATYDEFWIDDEVHKYTLHVKGYRGTAGDSLATHDGAPFTAKDKDNDSHSKNCAVLYKGAWWYTGCHASNLNGAYLKGVHESHADGIEWYLFRGHKYSLKDTVIQIRPKGFTDALTNVTPH